MNRRKIAIPIRDGRMFGHFGKAPEFRFYTTEGLSVVDSKILSSPVHTHGSIPNWLIEQGTTDIITGGIGQHALEILKGKQISIFSGVVETLPDKLVDDLLSDSLVYGQNYCDH